MIPRNEFQDGGAAIIANPHPALAKACERGFRFQYRFVQDCDWCRDLDIQVLLAQEVIASADFTEDFNARTFYNQNVMVAKEFRGQGIGPAIYLFAEKLVGRSLHNFWDGTSNGQSDEAKAMWANPERPFGR